MRELLLGNEAVACGARDAGVNVVSSYPGTPSTEITENLAKFDGLYCEWAPNEKVALEVAIGAAVSGSRAMACMKHVGLNVAADPLFTVSYTGVNGGLVAVVADDPGMFSSQNEQDTRYYALSAHIPVIEPSDSQECYEYIQKAFEISEMFDTPVIFRLTTRVAHQRSLVEIGERQRPERKPYRKDIMKYVMMPGMAKKRHLVVDERMRKTAEYAERSPLNRVKYKGRELGVITSGICYQYVREVFPEASVLKLGMTYPLPEGLIREFASKVDRLIVVEELEPFIEDHIRQMGLAVEGKKYFTNQGELGTEIIRKSFYGEELPSATLAEKVDAPARPPVMCPGCPHRGIYFTLSRMNIRVCGDIGCYTLGAMAPYFGIDTCVCMGASVSMSHGMEKADKEAGIKVPTVAVIGDSTFIHSGITGLIDIVYNKGNSTVIILDNSITGMTGHQQNPTTGYTIRMEETPAVDLVKLGEAIGIKRIRIEDPFDLKGMRKAIEEEIAAEEPSLIIAQRPCALLKNVNYGAPVKIDTEKCRKCGSCMKLGCPAIFKDGGAYKIDSSICAGCELCVSLCAFGAIGKEK